MRLFLSALLIIIASAAWSQKIQYEMSFPNAVHHEAVIALTVSGIPAGPAVFRMSRSSPGRYATHEFGKNVYDVKAVSSSGAPLVITRIDGDVYEVAKHDDAIKVTYTLFGDYADGTYAGIDLQNIHLNMPAVVMWMKGMDQVPIEIKFNIPDGNAGKIATQLKPTANATVFTAPGLQFFMDSPTKIGDLTIKEWDVTNSDGKKLHFRIAFDISEGKDKVDEFTEKVKRLVQEEGAVYGEYPQYDYGTYTFLASINPYVHGDGMEHRNSTMISWPAAFNGANQFLEVFAHEYFHNWNVERIRPRTLEPFNFEKSNMSNELWLAEGFTQYYGNLLVSRAGFITPDNLINSFSGIVNQKLNSPGATGYSPIDASRHAVFVDAGVSVDRTNYPNMFTSYYTYGAAVALALDLELRSRFNKNLDLFMQALWKRFGKTEVPYTVATVQQELGNLTNAAFAQDFFTRYIYGHEAFDYANLLAKAGYQLQQPALGKAWMGSPRITETQKGLLLTSGTLKNTPLYKAGLDIDDMIESIDGTPVTKEDAIAGILNAHKPGDVLQVQFSHRGQSRSASLTLAGNPGYTIIPNENAGKPLTPEAKKFRDEWLGSKVGSK